MNAHQIFKAISPELRTEILSWLQKETKDAFRTSLYQIGAQRKLRPQYFQGKTREQQAQWLGDYLQWRNFDGIAEQMLQLWLLKAKTPMLTAFLDAAGIKHDGSGQVDDLPDSLDAKKAAEGIDAMLKDNPPAHVAVYLAMFQRQKQDGWPEVSAEIEKRPELKLAET